MYVKLKNNIKKIGLLNDKPYEVISITILKKTEKISQISFRILNENGIPSLYDKNCFDITDNSLDCDFVLIEFDENSIELLPKVMGYSITFWEDFFDLDKKAIKAFNDRFPKYKNKLFY